jgi:hypothetical protein
LEAFFIGDRFLLLSGRFWMSDEVQKLFEDAGGGAPDAVVFILVGLDDSFSADLDDLFFSEATRIEQGGKRHFDQFGNFDRAQLKGIGIREDADEGSDNKFGDSHNIVQHPEDLNLILLQSNFLGGLPEGGPSQIVIPIVKHPSRKRDLSLVMLHLVRSLGEEEMATPFFLKEREKDSRMGERGMVDDLSLSLMEDLFDPIEKIGSASFHVKS